ncbi:MAG: hypothetical protein CMB79_06015, partial [Filomicrobium sp.]|nr:hypothetical protein [Filomicrobium sp.]
MNTANAQLHIESCNADAVPDYDGAREDGTGDNQTQSVTVPINDDSVVEDNETFTVQLTNLIGVSASLVDTSDNATVTI